MKIQDILGAFLSAHGQHSLAAQAFESTDRNDWVRLGDEAIRSAPEHNRTHVCQSIKLALDAPENGGSGMALNFELRPEPHVSFADVTMYRAFMIPRDGGPVVDCGIASSDIEKLKSRIVGMYVAKEITVIR